jgi:hypothetical protein
MRITMMRVWIGVSLLVTSAAVAAQQAPPPPSTQGLPALTPIATPALPELPADRPARLLAAQQLAMTAYPELRTRGLQLRVETTETGSTVTIGFAERDRADVLGASRPRAAQLVVEATFDGDDHLSAAVLRGRLAKTAERRRIRALTSGIAQALDAEGALFGPTRREALLQRLDLGRFERVLGRLTASGATFQQGSTEDGLFWDVQTTTAAGEPVTLGFEPYAGRLVRVVKGGAQ